MLWAVTDQTAEPELEPHGNLLTKEQTLRLHAAVRTRLDAKAWATSTRFPDTNRYYRLQQGSRIRVVSLGDIDDAMEWVRGSALTVARGGTPTAAEDVGLTPEQARGREVVHAETGWVIPQPGDRSHPSDEVVGRRLIEVIRALQDADGPARRQLLAALDWWLAGS